jgi:flagellum-specific peptidoglycan hydrolase FlgJ
LLKTEGYATDPKYSDKLIRIIKDHGWNLRR